jgi:CubicO group peptidase (beta-lactamase class C family)
MKRNLLIVILIAFISCSQNNKGIETDFDHLLKDKFSEKEPGGIILVQKGLEVVYLNSYGVADTKTNKKITANTIFNTGSISKTFVSNGILILQEQGLLSVEDSIYKYFPDFKNKDIAKKIKIKHLLSHSSGLPDNRKTEENKEFYMTAKDKGNFEPLKNVDSLVFEPGEKFEYSNPAYNGLALIIEQVSQKKWQDFIAEKIFKPSGMSDSRITDGDYPTKDVSHAYIKADGRYKEFDYGEYPTFAAAGNGGVWCSVLDLAKYELAIRNNLFLSKQTIEKSRTILSPKNWKDTTPPKIGYSWFIQDKNDKKNKLGVKIVSHTGSQGGFRSFFISIPEKDIIYAGLFNRPVKNLSEVRAKGLELLKKHHWIE